MKCMPTVVCASLLVVVSYASAASPSLGLILPRGAQRGTTAEVHLHGARIGDAVELMIYNSTLVVEKIEAVDDNHLKAMIAIPADARLGEYDFRVRTKTGISEVQSFHVGLFPTVAEVEPNNEFAAPQAISLNVTVAGIVQSEDVDYFVVQATKGQRITAEIEGVRLGNTLFDPYVAILNTKRFELSASDDTALFLQDSVASIIVPEDGSYIIQVRETSYAGADNCHYRLHVGTFPRPTAVYPAGGRVGEELPVTFLGDVAGDIAQTIKLPDAADENYHAFAEQNGEKSPSGNMFRVTDLANVLEAEPNNAAAEGTKATDAPVALNGIISSAGDHDFFKVPMKAGQSFDIHCYARRLRSNLDPVMHIVGPDGKYLAGADDNVGPDSYFRFAPPADGEYTIYVHDHLLKGGADYVYRVEIQPVVASLTLNIPPVARASQDRWAMPVPRGNRFATLMIANRANFGGPLTFSAAGGMPAGVTMQADTMYEDIATEPIVFEAAPDAPLASGMVDLRAAHADPNAKIAGGYKQQVDLVIAAPNTTVYYSTYLDRLAVGVTEEVPFKIDIVQPKVPIVQNGSMNLKVVATRKEGFTKPITLYFPFAPPGVGAAASAVIPEGQNEVLYPINANGAAAVRKWKVVVIGHADVGNGPVWVSTQLAELEIVPPYANFTVEMAAAEQGKPAEVVCKIAHATPFEGVAKVNLVGLPAGVASKELEFGKDTPEIVFPVTIDPSSPVGQHQTLFCQFVVVQNGEPIVHNSGGGGVLRIDAPPPAPADPAAVPAAAAAPAPTEKRLTRLEKLRLEQAERQKKLAEEAAQGGS